MNGANRIEMTPREVFANNLRTLRLRAQMSQDELAEKLGVDQRSVSNWERFYVEPDLNMIGKICKLFDTTFFYLLDRPRSYP